ncbi:prepilin-type N-terminal cleavage/methylation domain-containing protein [Diaphorobacter sp. HDW4A]|uniref:PilW family protein n=1 Tax=Diaphorobacter sp. HDW4A TaxID=2714924 RepID=UPI00140754EC|nr:PilW family protein [Diaphorobacter sp. HDW4A]QIL78769.1 prepilin-type N-terminal cleavage/methylation domain-containing protein [Diaphorobacter sp. HDW4A]
MHRALTTAASSPKALNRQHFQHARYPARVGQSGFTLLELMVGIAIGLMAVAVAMGALMASRSVSGTVSDVSQLQQQSAYAFRIIGTQLRHAGSLRLNLAPLKSSGDAIDAYEGVAFETTVDGFNPTTDTLSGIDNPTGVQYALTTGFRNYSEKLYNKSSEESMLRNCLGQENSSTLIQSRFRLNEKTNELECAGSGEAQALVQNVANFRVRYLRQTEPAPYGDPLIQYVKAADVSNWKEITAVEICIVMYGSEIIGTPASSSSYFDCAGDDGTSKSIDITTLSAPRTNRIHMVFRNTYQIRSQGLLG